MLAPGPRQAGRPFDLLNPTLAGWLSSGSNLVSLTPDGDQPFSPYTIFLFINPDMEKKTISTMAILSFNLMIKPGLYIIELLRKIKRSGDGEGNQRGEKREKKKIWGKYNF